MSLPPKCSRPSPATHETHIWPLGAVAELVATASAASTLLHINASTTPQPHLTLLDNGPGHPSATLTALITPSPWRTAALRIGSSLALLTKLSDGTTTAALLTDPPLVLYWASVSPQHPHLQQFLKGTPWDSYHQVADAFESIPSSGSLLVMSDLTPNPANPHETELDFSDPLDIRCPSTSSIRLSSSLCTYLQLLFLRPSAKMYVRGRIVRERRLSATMWGRTDFIYTPRAMPNSVATMRFGFDPHAAGEEFGMLIYCHGRLIRPYLRVGLQVPKQSDVKVVGVVEADFLTPTNNMQAFKRNRLYQSLLFSLDRWLKSFWQRYGSMQNVLRVHGHDPVRGWCRCDNCGYWRIVTPKEGAVNPDDISCQKWVCAFNRGGTTNCGPPDDEDVLHNISNEHTFDASKSKSDKHKKLQSPLSQNGGKAADISEQLYGNALRKRPRALQVRIPNWAEDGTAEGSSLTNLTTTAGTLAPRIIVHEMAAVDNRLISKSNLGMAQPTPQLVSPQLYVCRNGVNLSRNGIPMHPQVPASDATTLPSDSTPLTSFIGDGSVPRGQTDATQRSIEMKGTPPHGEVPWLTGGPIQVSKGGPSICSNWTGEPEQKVLNVDRYYSLEGAPTSRRQMQALHVGNTLKPSSSISHKEIFKSQILGEKGGSIMTRADSTNSKINMNREVVKRTPRSETKSAKIPKADSIVRETIISRNNVQTPTSPASLSTPPQLQAEIRAQKFSKRRQRNEDAFVMAEDYQGEKLPRKTDLGVEKGDEHDLQGASATEDDEHRIQEGGIDIMGIDEGVKAQKLEPSNSRSVPTLPGSGDTARYGGSRYVRGMKGNGRPGSGRSPVQNLDEAEMQDDVSTPQVLRVSDCFDENELNIGDDSPTDGVLRNKTHATKQVFANRLRVNPILSLGNLRGETQGAGGGQNFDALQVGSLCGMNMSKPLELFGEGGISRTPQLYLRTHAPVSEPPQGVIQRRDEEPLFDMTEIACAAGVLAPSRMERPSLVAASSNEQELERTEMRRNSLQLEPDDTGNDETEPFEKREESDQLHAFETNAKHHASNFYAPMKRQEHNFVLRGGEIDTNEGTPSPYADTAETSCESADRGRGRKRRPEGGPSIENIAGTPLSSGREVVGGSHHDVEDNKTNSEGSQRGSQREKRRRVASDPLAVATEAAASAAQIALGNLSRQDALRHGAGVPSANLPVQMTWSQIAVSAAVAAGAATAAAMAVRQSRAPGIPRVDRNGAPENTALTSNEERLREAVSLRGPATDEEMKDNMSNLYAQGDSKEITNRICQTAGEDKEQAMSKQLESCRVQLQTQTNALQKVRELVHIFLDKVVGILQMDDSHEPIENQLEYYLRLIDALPTDTSN